MYHFSFGCVNGTILGSKNHWIIFRKTPTGLRQTGPIYTSRDAALAEVRAA